MPRYIDAERFSEHFDMMCDAGGVLAPVTKAVREMVKKLIKAEPTTDVEPVRHGRWIECDYKKLEHGFLETYPKAGVGPVNPTAEYVAPKNSAEELSDKHWEESRQIAIYDDELRQARELLQRAANVLFESDDIKADMMYEIGLYLESTKPKNPKES